jgi:hypothetical protein
MGFWVVGVDCVLFFTVTSSSILSFPTKTAIHRAGSRVDHHAWWQQRQEQF